LVPTEEDEPLLLQGFLPNPIRIILDAAGAACGKVKTEESNGDRFRTDISKPVLWEPWLYLNGIPMLCMQGWVKLLSEAMYPTETEFINLWMEERPGAISDWEILTRYPESGSIPEIRAWFMWLLWGMCMDPICREVFSGPRTEERVGKKYCMSAIKPGP
jgi:hypothetical protein